METNVYYYYRLINSLSFIWKSNFSLGGPRLKVGGPSFATAEDWSNDAENSVLITGINYILKYIQIESSYFK